MPVARGPSLRHLPRSPSVRQGLNIQGLSGHIASAEEEESGQEEETSIRNHTTTYKWGYTYRGDRPQDIPIKIDKGKELEDESTSNEQQEVNRAYEQQWERDSVDYMHWGDDYANKDNDSRYLNEEIITQIAQLAHFEPMLLSASGQERVDPFTREQSRSEALRLLTQEQIMYRTNDDTDAKSGLTNPKYRPKAQHRPPGLVLDANPEYLINDSTGEILHTPLFTRSDGVPSHPRPIPRGVVGSALNRYLEGNNSSTDNIDYHVLHSGLDYLHLPTEGGGSTTTNSPSSRQVQFPSTVQALSPLRLARADESRGFRSFGTAAGPSRQDPNSHPPSTTFSSRDLLGRSPFPPLRPRDKQIPKSQSMLDLLATLRQTETGTGTGIETKSQHKQDFASQSAVRQRTGMPMHVNDFHKPLDTNKELPPLPAEAQYAPRYRLRRNQPHAAFLERKRKIRNRTTDISSAGNTTPCSNESNNRFSRSIDRLVSSAIPPSTRVDNGSSSPLPSQTITYIKSTSTSTSHATSHQHNPVTAIATGSSPSATLRRNCFQSADLSRDYARAIEDLHDLVRIVDESSSEDESDQEEGLEGTKDTNGQVRGEGISIKWDAHGPGIGNGGGKDSDGEEDDQLGDLPRPAHAPSPTLPMSSKGPAAAAQEHHRGPNAPFIPTNPVHTLPPGRKIRKRTSVLRRVERRPPFSLPYDLMYAQHTSRTDSSLTFPSQTPSPCGYDHRDDKIDGDDDVGYHGVQKLDEEQKQKRKDVAGLLSVSVTSPLVASSPLSTTPSPIRSQDQPLPQSQYPSHNQHQHQTKPTQRSFASKGTAQGSNAGIKIPAYLRRSSSIYSHDRDVIDAVLREYEDAGVGSGMVSEEDEAKTGPTVSGQQQQAAGNEKLNAKEKGRFGILKKMLPNSHRQSSLPSFPSLPSLPAFPSMPSLPHLPLPTREKLKALLSMKE
ncbi:MAG: hypothetical protein M1819_001990 [Sarea resinae]|nr:MAG: hypothetical protein M1819_001990 [Sarea resinae]